MKTTKLNHYYLIKNKLSIFWTNRLVYVDKREEDNISESITGLEKELMTKDDQIEGLNYEKEEIKSEIQKIEEKDGDTEDSELNPLKTRLETLHSEIEKLKEEKKVIIQAIDLSKKEDSSTQENVVEDRTITSWQEKSSEQLAAVLEWDTDSNKLPKMEHTSELVTKKHDSAETNATVQKLKEMKKREEVWNEEESSISMDDMEALMLGVNKEKKVEEEPVSEKNTEGDLVDEETSQKLEKYEDAKLEVAEKADTSSNVIDEKDSEEQEIPKVELTEDNSSADLLLEKTNNEADEEHMPQAGELHSAENIKDTDNSEIHTKEEMEISNSDLPWENIDEDEPTYDSADEPIEIIDDEFSDIQNIIVEINTKINKLTEYTKNIEENIDELARIKGEADDLFWKLDESIQSIEAQNPQGEIASRLSSIKNTQKTLREKYQQITERSSVDMQKLKGPSVKKEAELLTPENYLKILEEEVLPELDKRITNTNWSIDNFINLLPSVREKILESLNTVIARRELVDHYLRKVVYLNENGKADGYLLSMDIKEKNESGAFVKRTLEKSIRQWRAEFSSELRKLGELETEIRDKGDEFDEKVNNMRNQITESEHVSELATVTSSQSESIEVTKPKSKIVGLIQGLFWKFKGPKT